MVMFRSKKGNTALNALTRIGNYWRDVGVAALKEMNIPLFSEAIGAYVNGNYAVLLLEDGTKIKFNEGTDFVAEVPDTIDLTITTQCDVGCPYCYAGCGSDGKHAELFAHPEFYNSLTPFTEVAINLNNMDHPQLDQFLIEMKKRQVVVNGTINEEQLLDHMIYRLERKQREGLLHGIGISYNRQSGPIHDAIMHSRRLRNVVIHVIVGLFAEEDMKMLEDNNLSLLVLGYKRVGRGETYSDPRFDENLEWLREYMKRYFAGKESGFSGIAFDTLGLEQLGLKDIIPADWWELGYMGEDGTSSFYLDMVNEKYAVSSSSEHQWPIGDKPWDVCKLFRKARIKNL